jgi:peptidylprolyl isomerase
MVRAKAGDKVKVHYTGRLEDGTVFDSSTCVDEGGCECSSGPLEFVVGEGSVIPGFDQAVVNLAPGECKTVTIPVAQAYGERNEEMVAVVNRTDLPADLNPELGMQLEVTQEEGGSFSVLVTELNEQTVTLDANHPLAGRELTFDIQLLEIG